MTKSAAESIAGGVLNQLAGVFSGAQDLKPWFISLDQISEEDRRVRLRTWYQLWNPASTLQI